MNCFLCIFVLSVKVNIGEYFGKGEPSKQKTCVSIKLLIDPDRFGFSGTFIIKFRLFSHRNARVTKFGHMTIPAI